MKVVIIKPRKDRQIRIESDLTIKQLRTAQAFNPESLLLLGTEKEVVFNLQVTNAPSAVGHYGVRLNSCGPATEKIVQTLHVSVEEDAAFTALVVRTQEQLTKIEEQVLQALKAYEKAAETLVEV